MEKKLQKEKGTVLAKIRKPEPTAPLPPEIRAFKVNMSKADAMPCDVDELSTIMLSIQLGKPARIRSGIFNPSYYVSITLDKERIAEVARENSTIYESNQHDLRYNEGQNQIAYKGLEPLKDIFAGIDLRVIAHARSQQLLKQNQLSDEGITAEEDKLPEPAAKVDPVWTKVGFKPKG